MSGRIEHIWIPIATGVAFGVLHRPGTGSGTPDSAVLIVPPWGWDEVAGHRERLAWAEHLAAAGRPTLRIDLPGTGDSSGGPMDPDLADAWVAAVRTAAVWLRQQGHARVAIIGMGVGGLVATQAAAAGAPVDDLVLWSSPRDGRAFVREARAFGLLQSRSYGLRPSATDDGAIEVSGFVLSGETAARLAEFDPAQVPAGSIRRALLLSRDGLRMPAALQDHLEAQGVQVTTGQGIGWAATTIHPEQFNPPRALFDTVEAWLADGNVDKPRQAAPIAEEPQVVATPGSAHPRYTEEVLLAGDSQGLFGVLTLPIGTALPLTAVFLNAGAVRHTGPNRMWVEAARRWAAAGVATLRLDVGGIGESAGDPSRYRDVAEFYREEVRAQVRSFLSILDQRWPGQQRMLIGLCAGGYWAIQVAAEDSAVNAIVLINAGALVWSAGLIDRRRTRGLRRLRRSTGWAGMARRALSLRRIAHLIQAIVVTLANDLLSVARRIAARALGRSRPDAFGQLFSALHDRGTQVTIAFSDEEPLASELRESGVMRRAAELSNVRFERLPGSDHTLRPLEAQHAVQRLLDAALNDVTRRHRSNG